MEEIMSKENMFGVVMDEKVMDGNKNVVREV